MTSTDAMATTGDPTATTGDREATPTPRPFDEVTAVEPLDHGGFAVELDADWGIAGRPNGGSLLAMAGRAATVVAGHDHVLAASAHFVRSPEAGPAVISTEVLRSGRSVDQVRCRLHQDGATCVEAVVTVGQLDPGAEPHPAGGVPDPGSVDHDDAVRILGPTPTGIDVPLLRQVDLRLDPSSLGFADGGPTGKGELRGWLALPGGAPFDPCALLFAVDSFPPATFDVTPSGWVPTLELTTYVRALPAPGPVRVLHRAHMISGELVDESCHVWDRLGRLVAQSTQLAGIRVS